MNQKLKCPFLIEIEQRDYILNELFSNPFILVVVLIQVQKNLLSKFFILHL